MTQTLTPIGEFFDQGKGVASIEADAVAATDTAIQFINDGNLVLFIVNQNAAAVTATLQGEPDTYGRDADEVIVVPIGSVSTKIGFFSFASPAMFNKVGIVNVTLSLSASVKLALYRLTKLR